MLRKAKSWAELLEQLYQGSWNASLGRYRSPFAFRGHSSSAHLLTTSLNRLTAGRNARRLELALLRNFRKYAHAATAAPPHAFSVWHWLAVGQHHGLPTRLIDWTYSPLVALHFAAGQPQIDSDDGAIWCVNFVEANRLLPRRLRRILEDEHSETLTIDMLDEFDSLGAFDALSRTPFVVFIEPPSLDSRMLHQFALFSMMPGPDQQLEAWLSSHPTLWRKVVVPSALKWEVRDKLDQANINERTLFPGLDGLSRWLERYYYQRRDSPGVAMSTEARSATGTSAGRRRPLRFNRG
jgi:FRG domain